MAASRELRIKVPGEHYLIHQAISSGVPNKQIKAYFNQFSSANLGEELHSQDSNFHTPLSIACSTGNMELIEFFLSKGADPNGYNGIAPLLATCASTKLSEETKIAIIRSLHQHKADLNIKTPARHNMITGYNCTALDIAKQMHEPKVQFMLIRFGADESQTNYFIDSMSRLMVARNKTDLHLELHHSLIPPIDLLCWADNALFDRLYHLLNIKEVISYNVLEPKKARNLLTRLHENNYTLSDFEKCKGHANTESELLALDILGADLDKENFEMKIDKMQRPCSDPCSDLALFHFAFLDIALRSKHEKFLDTDRFARFVSTNPSQSSDATQRLIQQLTKLKMAWANESEECRDLLIKETVWLLALPIGHRISHYRKFAAQLPGSSPKMAKIAKIMLGIVAALTAAAGLMLPITAPMAAGAVVSLGSCGLFAKYATSQTGLARAADNLAVAVQATR